MSEESKTKALVKHTTTEVALRPQMPKAVSVKAQAKKEVSVKMEDPTKKVREKIAENKRKSENPDPVIIVPQQKAATAKPSAKPSAKTAAAPLRGRADKKSAAAPRAEKTKTTSKGLTGVGAAKKNTSAGAVKKTATKAAPVKTGAPKKSTSQKKAEAAAQSSLAQKNVLFVGSECAPFFGTGGLGEVLGSLPQAINGLNSGITASVILPLYEMLEDEFRDKLEFMCHINVPLAWRNQYCGLFRLNHEGTVYYFVDNEYYFKRHNLYGYYDDGERYAFFCRAVNELIPQLGFKPDILHCHDWQTALVPIYYKLFYMYYPGYENIHTVFTVHNIEYQGKYGKNIIEDVFGIGNKEYLSLEHGGCINLVKGAMDYADALSTVSPTYARELEDAFYAHGLENIVRKNRSKMRGILNGVDTAVYNPEKNPALFVNYGASNPTAGKAKNKAELQKMLSLPVNPDVPLIAIISRLVSHKGLDLVRFALDEILKQNIQLVVLGKGDPDYEGYFTYTQTMYENKVASVIAFNKDLSHKIYAAADIFLMPSKSEPCGLSQMMACRYGTVPVVRATGGLNDSIQDCGTGDKGNGFVFDHYDAAEMLHAVARAAGLYTDYREKWNGLVKRCMETDFSWQNSAGAYVKFYNELL
ncbi:MAG: glycogen synthase GlgA [Firmicutes bacterium]|nr:glycogen synthase GlgA [Bacillota bacterium]